MNQDQRIILATFANQARCILKDKGLDSTCMLDLHSEDREGTVIVYTLLDIGSIELFKYLKGVFPEPLNLSCRVPLEDVIVTDIICDNQVEMDLLCETFPLADVKCTRKMKTS